MPKNTLISLKNRPAGPPPPDPRISLTSLRHSWLRA